MSENMLKNSTSKKVKTVTWGGAWLVEQNKKTQEIIVSTILVTLL